MVAPDKRAELQLVGVQVSLCQLESDRPCIGHLRLMGGISYGQSDQKT